MALIKKSSNKFSQAALIRYIINKCSTSMGWKQHQNHVPTGHFVVYVGCNKSRYVIPISFLTQPEFQSLLNQAEKGFRFGLGIGLIIPCEEHVFESLTSLLHF